MDADRFREEVLAELERRPVDLESARRTVGALRRRHRQRVSVGVVVAVTAVMALAAGVALTRGSDDPSSVDVVSGGEDGSSTSAVPVPGSELFFLVPGRIPPGMALVDVAPPGENQAHMTTATPYTIQKWAHFGVDGELLARFDVTVSEGTLAQHPGEATSVGTLPATFDAVGGVVAFESAPGHLVTVASRHLTRVEMEAVGATWVGGAGTSFTIQGPPGFELVVTEESEQSTGPDLRAAFYGDGEKGFTIVIDEPINDQLGTERLSPGGGAITVRGHDGVVAPVAVGLVGPSYRPPYHYLSDHDLVLRWRERGSTVALLGVGLSEDELLAVAEDLRVGPLPPDLIELPTDVDPYCGAIATFRTTEEAIDPDGHPAAYALSIFEFARTVAPDEVQAPLDVVLGWLRTGAARPVPDAVIAAELALTQQWADSCADDFDG